MIQARPQGGGLPYAPHRDLVNCFPAIARQAAYCLDAEYREPWLQSVFDHFGVTERELAEAVRATAGYINQCRVPEMATIDETVKASGLLELNPIAQLAMLAKIGQVVMATYYGTSRDALRVDEKPLHLDALLETASEICSKLQEARTK